MEARKSPQANFLTSRPAATPSSGANTAFLGVMTLIVLATVLVYLPAIRGGMLWDDDGHLTRPELRSFGGLARIWCELGATQQYYPFLHSVFWVEHRLWGDSMLAYHLANVLLHAAAACLLYLVLLRLNVPGAAFAAAIFAVHPVEVESVAWISEQKNTLSAVFYLSAMLAYLRFHEASEKGEGGGRKDDVDTTKWHVLSLALFTLGLLTKTVTATLPAALLVIFWWQRGRLSWREHVLPLVPFFLLGAAAGGLTAFVERKLIGAEGASFELSILQRGLIAGRAIWFYLGKLIWPTNLVFIYPRWDVDPAVWWQWLFPLSAVAATVALWAARSRWRAPLAGWLFFVGTLLPVLGFLNVYPFVFSFVADHFQYLAGLGVIVLVAAGLTMAVARLPPATRWIGNMGCAALVVGLAVLTMFESSIYGNVVQLYKTTLTRNPACWMAANNLGAYWMDHDREQEAEPFFREALRLRPDYPEAKMNLGVHFAHVGQPQSAIDLYERALELRPDFAEAENNWGNALVDLKRQREAIEHYQAAARLDPKGALPRYYLANTWRDLGQASLAEKHYQEALQLRPDFVEAHNNLGILLAKGKRLHDAIAEFQNVIRLQPDYLLAYGNLARAYAALGRRGDAIAAAERALELARSTGQQELASQIESWLTAYRAETARVGGRDQVAPVK